jgi:hypothetical protein
MTTVTMVEGKLCAWYGIECKGYYGRAGNPDADREVQVRHDRGLVLVP